MTYQYSMFPNMLLLDSMRFIMHQKKSIPTTESRIYKYVLSDFLRLLYKLVKEMIK